MAVLSPELRQRAEEIVARYPTRRSAIMPLLYLLQSVEGWVSREGLREVAEVIGVTTAEVEAVATFYTMYRLHPAGDYVLSICTNVPCALLGGKRLYERATETLGPGAEERTDDGRFTLHEEECLGACDAAPVVQVNFLNYDRMNEDGLLELIGKIRAGEVPPPSRGQVPGTLREISRLLAGLDPAPATGPPAEASA